MTTPDELLKIEKEILEKVVGSWKADVGAIKEMVLTLAAQVDNGDMSVIVDQVLAAIMALDVPSNMDDEALRGVDVAHGFGQSVVSEALDADDLPDIAVSNNSKKAVKGLSEGALTALQEAKDNLSRPLVGSGLQSILTAVNPLLQNPAKVEAAVVWSVNNASNSAVSKLSLKMGETMTWISERDGCVHCLAYSGERSGLTGFPKGLTFGSKPLATEGTLPHPPLHPHCRCTIEPGITDDYADALKRESVRSILRGFKMESESEKVRIDAAKALLETDPVAPASVKKYAKRRINNYEAKKELRK